jgi:hypothetical protein
MPAPAPKTGAASDTRMSWCLCALLSDPLSIPRRRRKAPTRATTAAQGSKASLRIHSSLLHTSDTRVSHLHRRLLAHLRVTW